MSEAIKAEFVGDGRRYMIGVPSRDLTADEWDALGERMQAALIEVGLFRVAKSTKRKKAVES